MKLLLRNHQPPGDIVMLTAAARDLHRAHPGRFTTAVDTSCPELWQHNSYVVPLDRLGQPDRVIECAYPLVHESNQRPFHFIHGFAQDLERQLEVPIPVTDFHGDLYFGDDELARPSPVEAAGHLGRYWVVVAGGKLDFTTKWWPTDSFQAVVDHFAGRIQFVQCGARRDWHPPLHGVLSLVGKTDLRQLMRVIRDADGVICPVTLAMHLAAAVPLPPGRSKLRPCVVVAGGREPPHWEAYPGHQFLHVVGALDCCAQGGCWRRRCQPLGDGTAGDTSLCVRPTRVGDGPLVGQCMAMITPQQVISAVNLYEAAAPPVDPSPIQAQAADPEVTVQPRGVAVTIGTGPFATVAHLAAKELRALTGLDTVILGDEAFAESGLADPSLLKFRLFELVQAEHLLYFDADMVCLESWDPRQFFGSRSIAAVRDRVRDEVVRESKEWGVPLDEYFNAGFFIASAAHHKPWLRLAESIHATRPTVLLDQSALNAARRQLGIPLKLLDRRFNWMGFGSSALSLDVPVVMAHKLVPRRIDKNVDYFNGGYDLLKPTLTLDDSEADRLAGRSFVLVSDDGQRRERVQLRDDGTLLPLAAPPAPSYWFVHVRDHRPTLAFASEGSITAEFIERLGGTWAEVKRGDSLLVDETRDREPPLTEHTARAAADEFVRNIAPYPASRFAGRGIVICGGGAKYLPCAWVCIGMLRQLGCQLPIELWQLRRSEADARLNDAFEELGVRQICAAEVRLAHPVRYLGGWELKAYSLLHSAFEEVLSLDADNVPVRDPTSLFDAPEFAATGAVFWPDYGRLGPERDIWRVCEVPYRDEPEFESGQMLIDKRQSWRPLQLAMHLNEHSDFYYRHIHGDKETFHMAWRMLGAEYAMVPHPIEPLPGTMCQHDFKGRRLFQHRNMAKWTLNGQNPRVEGFEREEECLTFLRELDALLR